MLGAAGTVPAPAAAVEGVVVWVDAAAQTAGVVRAGGGISCRAIPDIECDAEDPDRTPGAPAACATSSPIPSSCAWRAIREADFQALVGQRVRLVQGDGAASARLPVLAGDAEGGPLGKRVERRTGVVTTADATDYTVCVEDAWWYRGQDLEVQALPPAAAAAAAAAGAGGGAGVRWRRATAADVPTLVGRRVRFRAARATRPGAARASSSSQVAAGRGGSHGDGACAAVDPQDSE